VAAVADQLDFLFTEEADAREKSAAAVEARTGNKGLADTIRNASDYWWQAACIAARELAETGREFTSFELTQKPYLVPEPDHPNRWGGLVNHMRAEGLIEPVGWDNSKRGTSKGSGLRVWKGTAEARGGVAA
jgi:hypothetical protein